MKEPIGAAEGRRGEEGCLEGRTVRVFHSLGKTGGTVVSRCLGCMEKVALLSEIHPDGPAMFAPLFGAQPEQSQKWDPLVQAREWFDWFEDDYLAFEKARGAPPPTVVGYVNRYRAHDAQVPPGLRLRFVEYDKALNRQGGKR